MRRFSADVSAMLGRAKLQPPRQVDDLRARLEALRQYAKDRRDFAKASAIQVIVYEADSLIDTSSWEPMRIGEPKGFDA